MGWLELACTWAVLAYAVFLLANIIAARAEKKRQKALKFSEDLPAVSIIIPVRNEDGSILTCLQSIAAQDFPAEKLEVIVVNDHCEDNTISTCTPYLQKHFANYQVLHLSEKEAGKKTAIQRAVEQSTGTIIITRDADTVSENKDWLKSIACAFEEQSCDVLISPVLLGGPNSFAASFQKYENLAVSLIGAGMAARRLPMVCSGANFSYTKAAFALLNPYADNRHIASGDDMFLLKKAYSQKIPIGINLQEGSPVTTPVFAGFGRAWQQRLRWASKTTRVSTPPILFSGLILLMGNIAALIALIHLFIDTSYLPFGLFTLTLKVIIDFLLLFLSARMFSLKLSFAWYLPAFVLNLFYTPAMATASLFAKPNWKGRSA